MTSPQEPEDDTETEQWEAQKPRRPQPRPRPVRKPNTPNVRPPGPWRSFFRRNRRVDMIREIVALALEKGVELEITDSREGLHIRVPAREDLAK